MQLCIMGCTENLICPGAENHWLWQDCQIILSAFTTIFLRAQQSKTDSQFLSAADTLLQYMLYCLVLILNLLGSYRFSILTKCCLIYKLEVCFCKKLPLNISLSKELLYSLFQRWKTYCRKPHVPETVFGALVGAKLQLLEALACALPVKQKKLKKWDTKDCNILRKILVKFCFSE